MKKLLFSLMMSILFPLSASYAVQVSSLYQAEILVASQTEDQKQQAVADGFLQVLIKLTGDAQIGNNPVIRLALRKADYYVQEYTYLAPAADASEYQIKIRYESDDINRLLKKAGVAYWGENRPLLLVWLSIEDGSGNAEIVASEAPGNEYSTLKQQGRNYGVPLIFPMMDMDDMNKVSVNDVNSMTVSILSDAAKRYSPDALLIGNISKTTAAGVQGKWRLVLADNSWSWVINEKTTADEMTAIMHVVSQTLAKNFVVKTANAQDLLLKLQVTNVTQRDDLSQLMQYLKQLTPVEQVDIVQVSGDVVELSVIVRGSLTGFLKNATIGDATNTLVYQWMH
jgi:hypothetical protein